MASISEVAENILSARDTLIKVSFSSALDGAEYKKTALRPIMLKKGAFWQAEGFRDNKAFHTNIPENEARVWLIKNIPLYGQINLFFSGRTLTFTASKNGSFKLKESGNLMKPLVLCGAGENNRKKEYILKEGENIPALVDLGVFTKEFKIVSGKYDKFKQINRFVELIDDFYSEYSEKEITILDFGCGKSYLTFIVYYYFVKIKKIKAKIIGYDLKADVVADCNRIAEKYGYDDLKFVVSDVTRDVLYDERIDMIISLHACDTATDYALYYAISKGVKGIFSVPCCQHEINSSIRAGGELDIFLKYGLIKERMSALLTDSIRAMILEDTGYSVDVIEFVDFAHSPKNIMLRAKKNKKPRPKNREAIRALIEKYKIKQTLFELTEE